MHDKFLSIAEHLKLAFTTLWGWILILFSALWAFVKPEAFAFAVVAIAVLMDLVWGIASAVKRKQFILSESLRETFKKVAIYGSSLLTVYAIERILREDWLVVTRVLCVFAAACELISASASMLIVKPDMIFLRLFRLQLKGEIAKKLGIDTDKIFTDDHTEVNTYSKT